MAGGAAFEIILTALLAFFTAGVGAAATLGSKGARLMKPLAKLGEKITELAKKLSKRFKPKKTKVGGTTLNEKSPSKGVNSEGDNKQDKNNNEDEDEDERTRKARIRQ